MQFVRTLGATEPPTNSNFEAFGGGAWRGLHWPSSHCGSPWVLKYLYCHQMITQTHSRGDRRGLEKVQL